ncbi:MAG: GTP 3',8-cyclase MoaA [Gammaproteobacteria bacterium]|nr:GTP 3',8-cyclase MoaA [Gammaproteobacteria bacterium]
MLQDEHGRTFKYLRLSITHQCNFRCIYCLPDGYHKTPEAPPFLSVPEIRRLVTAFAEMGFGKIRLTGGEPTLRKDFLTIAKTISQIPCVEKVMLSTNGYRLCQDAKKYQEGGIVGLNISVDSLNPEKFKIITGHDKLFSILEGIEKAIFLNLHPIKINTVLMKGINDHELPNFLSFVQNKPIRIRFIELMPTGFNQVLFHNHHFRLENLKNELQKTGWVEIKRFSDSGPAQEFMHEDYRGTVGIIAPYSKKFCETCNRLRITSLGELKLCLFGNQKYSLRPLLAHDNQKSLLQKTVNALLSAKQSTHALHSGNYGNVIHFATMGG